MTSDEQQKREAEQAQLEVRYKFEHTCVRKIWGEPLLASLIPELRELFICEKNNNTK